MSTEWMTRGACRQVDPDLFFAPPGMTYIPKDQRDAAKAVCGQCPVARECLRYALDHPEYATDGIWAATTTFQRGQLRRRRQRRTQEVPA